MAEAQKNSGNLIASGDAVQLARRYAKALYDLAEERNVLDAVANDIRALDGLWQSDAALRDIVADPRLKRPQLMATMKAIAAKSGFNPLTANTLQLLAQNRRLAILPYILNRFMAELAARRGEHQAEVSSAQPLSADQMKALTEKLTAMAGGKVNLVAREDRSLLGGFIVRIGSRMIDASVKSKLTRLERQLKTTTVSSHKGAA